LLIGWNINIAPFYQSLKNVINIRFSHIYDEWSLITGAIVCLQWFFVTI